MSALKDHLFTEDHKVDDDGNEYGMTHEDLAGAISVWSTCHEDTYPTIAGAATAFNVSRDMVRQVVHLHPWMFINGDRIEHDSY